MPRLNNEEVSIGDRLYDTTNGVGTVSALTDKSIEVLFADGRRITFNEHGQLNGILRLFWHYPIFLVPPKDLRQWEKTMNAMVAIHQIISDN